ncbi:MAG: 4Fe-4S dicluster domain-containing protein [Oscillospiraceae bacterium]|nr:4Fe-4S dicluster domain-containing protein [Oscillospiraceae bacterium]
MKKVYVNEDWCLGCHLCEFYCAAANSGKDLIKAFKYSDKKPVPRIKVEEGSEVNFAVQCRHCEGKPCVKGCIAGALSIVDGVVVCDENKCVGCYTCVLSCPFGCIVIDEEGHRIQKCDLCTKNHNGEPACVQGCPNKAIVFEER